MKEHIEAQMINELRSIAQKYHNFGCLREKLSECVKKYMKLDKEWNEKK